MSGYRIVWEDEAKAREIELFAEYTLQDGVVQVHAIRPSKVTFYCLQTRKPQRTIGVHTATGRRMLTEQYLAGRISEVSLEEEIRTQLELLDETLSQQIAS